jgi:aminoglycoside phosphotransferase (APT) family kinase protein
MYRLGDELVVRLPRVERAVAPLLKEREWQPRLAPRLPLAVPIPLAHGVPGDGYAFEWSVYRWLEGEPATHERIADPAEAARDLAAFVTGLERIDATDGPPAP